MGSNEMRSLMTSSNSDNQRIVRGPGIDSPKQGFSTGVTPVDFFLGLSTLAKIYQEIIDNLGQEDFIKTVLKRFAVSYGVSSGSIDHLPKQGPTVVVSNHPFGAIEGLVLADFFRQIRPDTKILANTLLKRIPEMKDHFIFVNPFSGVNAVKANIFPLREALDWLKAGGMLVVFPSGTVSHLHLSRREVIDPPWNPSVSWLIRKSKATVVPIFLPGRNSALFHVAGLIHPLLRTALLPREFLNKQGRQIQIDIGKRIPFQKLEDFNNDEEMVTYLRMRTFLLKNRRANRPINLPFSKITRVLKRPKTFEPVVAPVPKELLQAEIEHIPYSQLLHENDDFSVFYAEAKQIPNVLQEIGRLRELAYREVGEGTGKSIDIDKFDEDYLHLFTWNIAQREVVGAYRMVATDTVIKRYGVEGLYSRTLFYFSPKLLEQMGKSLELGRSFVRSEYQKNYSALLFLWKGIGQYVARNPEYRNVFGTVSISNEYESVSRQIMIDFLQANNFLPELAKLIKARKAPKNVPIRGVDPDVISTVVKDINEISQLVAEIETKGLSVPVLLRQYLKLGGKILGFNIDPDFGEVLDALIWVDLGETDPKMLERYMGKQGLRNFLAYHKIDPKQ